jgi:hypothetical protein
MEEGEKTDKRTKGINNSAGCWCRLFVTDFSWRLRRSGGGGSWKENGILSEKRFGLINKGAKQRRFFCSTCVICFIYYVCRANSFYRFSITINLIISLIGSMQSLWNANT